ncbi:MAG: hypothetical protein AAGB24_08360 [Bacteroidota bacterium]
MKKITTITLCTILVSSCTGSSDKGYSEEKDRKMVFEILENLDSHTLDIDEKMSVSSEDIVHMAQGNHAITNLEDLRAMFIEERNWGHSEMKHEAFEIYSFDDHVIVRGGVKGIWYSKEGNNQMPFKTNNLITLKRTEDGELKIWHVIFNSTEEE